MKVTQFTKIGVKVVLFYRIWLYIGTRRTPPSAQSPPGPKAAIYVYCLRDIPRISVVVLLVNYANVMFKTHETTTPTVKLSPSTRTYFG